MRISFIFPHILWLLLIIIPLWAIVLAAPRRLPTARFWASLGLRTAMIVALILSLAGTQIERGIDAITTVFLIDSSDSITPSARSQAENFIQNALQSMREEDRAAIIVFGENALVERAPSAEQRLGQLRSVPVAARTNIQEALQLGLALLPADTQKRLVLLSDGGENSGNALVAEQLASARHVTIDYVDLTMPSSDNEALIAALDVPTNVRQGQQIELIATIESNVEQGATLRIFADDTVLLDQRVQLQPGENRFSLTVDALEQGFQRYRAQIEPDSDGRSQNNQAEAIVRVGGSAKILLIEGESGDGWPLRDALAANNIQADLIAPGDAPTDLTALTNYDGVVLINVPYRALPTQFSNHLPTYVRDLGKGLMMIGGERSYGVGGYSQTPIEEALPVYMDVRNRQERPNVAIVFVIDKSGSMNACHCSGPNPALSQSIEGGTPKIDIAKDAVVQASALLGEQDSIGVVAFNEGAQWALPVTHDANPNQVLEAVTPLLPDGQTDVRVGLVAAEEALLRTDAKIKHVILLTDGWSRGGDNLDVVQRMRDEGITTSVVGAGAGSAEYLADMAATGSGRYYPTVTMDEVPQIFVQETITAVGNYLIEEPFTPKYAAPSAILDGLQSGLPPLYGYNGSTPKETATTVLVGVEQSPVLAQWQYGLGRAVAWTSDTKGKWAKDWITWSEFPRFAAQMVQWMVPSASNSNLTTTMRQEGAQTVIEVQAHDPNGNPQDGLQLQASFVGNNGLGQEVQLTQIGPGTYRATVENPLQGTYIVQISGKQDNTVVAQETAGLVVPYSPEYRQGQGNPALLEALAKATNGRRLEQPADAFAPLRSDVTRAQEIALPLLSLVLLLLPLDIGVRRLMLRRSDFAPLFKRAETVPAAPPEVAPQFDTLQRAKQRARQRVGAPTAPAEPAPTQRATAPQEAAECTTAPTATAAPDDRLERLRQARDRARKRARGEE